MAERSREHEEATLAWRAFITGEQVDLGFLSRMMATLFSALPSNPRCKVCRAPFRGIGGTIAAPLGFGVGTLNPNLCNTCEKAAIEHQIGTETELSMLFADVRGSTAIAERLSPTEFRDLIDHFYVTATEVLVEADALIEKLIGDEVAGLFVPGVAGADHAVRAVQAGLELLRRTGHADPDGPWVEVGVGVHTGTAYVGAVGSSKGMGTITVLGDAANTTARLASAAAAGELLVSGATEALAPQDIVDPGRRSLSLKGKAQPFEVAVLRVA